MDPHDATPKWNIIFLIYAELLDGTTVGIEPSGVPVDVPEVITLDYLNILMTEIQEITTSDNFDLFVIENQVHLKGRTVVDDFTNISILQPDPVDPSKSILNKILPQIDTKHFGQKSETVTAAFKSIDTDPRWPAADKILLITWDHGSAFGIFKTVVQGEQKDRQHELMFENRYRILCKRNIETHGLADNAKVILNIIRNKKFKNKYKMAKSLASQKDMLHADSPPQFYIDMLSNHELAVAINDGFGPKGVEMLLMFNCCMQNMHTAYALKDCLKFLIAPEGMISMPGYDYKSIVAKIDACPGIDSKKLCRFVLSSMEKKFDDKGVFELFHEHSMFAIELTDYNNRIIEPLKRLSTDLNLYMTSITNADSNVSEINHSRDGCYELTLPLSYYIIDIINWLERLKVKSNDAYDKTFQHQIFLDNCQLAIVDQRVGSPTQVYQDNQAADVSKSPQGYAIYFPYGDEFDPRDLTRINFVDQGALNQDYLIYYTNWIGFLKEFNRKL